MKTHVLRKNHIFQYPIFDFAFEKSIEYKSDYSDQLMKQCASPLMLSCNSMMNHRNELNANNNENVKLHIKI